MSDPKTGPCCLPPDKAQQRPCLSAATTCCGCPPSPETHANCEISSKRKPTAATSGINQINKDRSIGKEKDEGGEKDEGEERDEGKEGDVENYCCSQEEGICSCDDKCFRKYAAYIHKHSHLIEGSPAIGHCTDVKVVSNSAEKTNNNHHHHDHHKQNVHQLHHDHQPHHEHHHKQNVHQLHHDHPPHHEHHHKQNVHQLHHDHQPHHEHHHHCEKRPKEDSCASCLDRAELDGTAILSNQDMSIMKCYCTSMKAFVSAFHNIIPGTVQPSAHTVDWECCTTSQHTIESDCCSGAGCLDEKDGEEDYIVEIGEASVFVPCFLSLNITGMTCTGCADKVVHVLKSMNSILPDSVKVSFLNSRAEMAFLPDLRGENEIVERLRKKTGFRVTIINSGSLEDAGLAKVRIGICDKETFDIIEKLEAVRNMRFIKRENGRCVLEIGYDPITLGVRDLLGSINSRNHKFDANIVDTPDEDTIVSEAERKHLERLGTIALAAGILTVPVVILAWAPLPSVDMALKYIIQMPLATIVMGMAYRIYLNAFKTIIYGGAGGSRIDMDVLVLVATLAAWGFSVTIFISNTISQTLGKAGKEPFFETCCLLVTLILAGRWVTGRVRMWALNRATAIGDESRKEGPKTISLVEGNNVRKIDERLLQYADVLVAEEGDVIATDGVVVNGEAEVDESLLTGEAKPTVIQIGRLVMAGSNIVNGRLKYRATRLMHENTVSVIKRMVRSAGGEKPKVQEMADKFAATLTPTILAVSLAVFIIWFLVGKLARDKLWSDSVVDAISYAVATLAVSCPCAIGLAVPMVMIFASRVAMRKCGFLFVNVIAAERGWRANKVVFDKTGTLTTGKLEVVFSKALDGAGWGDEVGGQVRTFVTMLCEGEKHPVSRALAASVGVPEGHSDVAVDTVVGKGLEAVIDGQLVRGGQPSWCSSTGGEHPIVKEVIQEGLTVFALSIDQELRAVFGLEDTIRPEAAGVIAELHKRCIETHIFSGDHKHAVEKVSKALGIPEENCRSSCSPEQKSSEITALQKKLQPTQGQNKKQTLERPIVLFLGDGTNDAVALTQADVGLSMSDSTSVAVSAADIAILSTSLTSVVDFLDLSKRVKTCIWVAFSYAVLWNFFAVLAAGGGFVVVRISPEWAGLGELGSVLPVVIIAAFVGVRWKGECIYQV